MSVIINHVTKLYGEQKALNDVNLNVEKCGIIGLLGPNGAGKSTLMKIVCCYVEPTNGSVDVCGYNIKSDPLEIKKRIGYLPENNPLYVDMYISEYLNFIANVYHVENKKERIDEIIEITGLVPERKKLIRQLSKGFRQRVGIAQAIIHDPEVLILDEPTTGLDPNQLTEIRHLIKTLGENKTVILSTHIMQEVEAVCDHVIIINKGIIIANDTTENIMAMKSSASLDIELKKPCPINPFSLFQHKKRITVINETDDSIKINMQLDTDDDLRDKVFKFAINNNYTILSMNIPEKKLEDVFIDLVNA